MPEALSAWFAAGGPALPPLAGVGLVLYALLATTTWRVWVEGRPVPSLGLVRVLVAVLPLAGLLGTVGGMIGLFAALGAGSSPASGIGEALIATQYALALAIPAFAWERVLTRRGAVASC
jgi:biopolymer transport protein ExbB/TolQ